MVPLTDQIEEHAQRKMDEIQAKKYAEENADQAFFRPIEDQEDVLDIEAQKKRNERHQAILK